MSFILNRKINVMAVRTSMDMMMKKYQVPHQGDFILKEKW